MNHPSAIEVRCRCGRRYHADPAHVGKAIRCRCGREVRIRATGSRKAIRRSLAAALTGLRPRLRELLRRWWRAPGVLTRASGLRRMAGTAGWAYLVGVAAFTILIWAWGDRWWPATALLFGPRWVILLPIPLVLLAGILVRPGILLLLGVSLVIAIGPAMGFRVGWRDWIRSDAHDLRIVTYNIEGSVNRRILSIPQALESLSPDVMVFQECTDRVSEPEYWPTGWTVRYDRGLCFGSRYPLMSTTEDEEISTGDVGGSGIGRLYRIQTPTGKADIVVVHLETPRKGLEVLRYRGSTSRMEPSTVVRDLGSRRISRWIVRETREAIVAGDFNMTVESRIYRQYWSDCENAFSAVGHGFGYTRVLKRFSVRIDHVLGCRIWQPVRAFVGPDLGSDHLPLVVDLRRSSE